MNAFLICSVALLAVFADPQKSIFLKLIFLYFKGMNS